MNEIATASIEEALDFAFNLIIPVIAECGRKDAALAQELLQKVSDYVSLRYAGEFGLAYEWLLNFDGLDAMCHENRVTQFKRQMEWLGSELQINT